jgi:ribosome-associated translation inhibitor RaiA
MKISVQVTFRHMDSSTAVEAAIHEQVERLERRHPGIDTCHVTIDAPHRHHQQGRHFQVRVQADGHGVAAVASRGSDLDPAHEDVYLALRDAFRALHRELEPLERPAREHVAERLH